MSLSSEKLPEPGTGPIAFGCVFLLIALAGVPLVYLLGSSWPAWTVLACIAIVVAALAARYGDPFVAKVLRWLPWWS